MNYIVITQPKTNTPAFSELKNGTLFMTGSSTNVYKKVYESKTNILKIDFNAIRMADDGLLFVNRNVTCTVITYLDMTATNEINSSL